MSFTVEIDHVVRRLDQKLACSLIATEAMKQLLAMHRHSPAVGEPSRHLHDYLARQFDFYQSRQIARDQLLINLEAACDLHPIID